MGHLLLENYISIGIEYTQMNLQITEFSAITGSNSIAFQGRYFPKCKKLFLELLSVFMSKIEMIQCLDGLELQAFLLMNTHLFLEIVMVTEGAA